MKQILGNALRSVNELQAIEYDETVGESLVATVREIGQAAFQSGMPEIVKTCQIGAQYLTIPAAMLIISKCFKIFSRQQPDWLAMLSAKDLAKRLAVSERSVWRMQSAGQLPEPVRFGATVRWESESINEWIAKGCPDG